MKFRARVWKFGDNINTDLILPSVAFYLKPEEQVRYVFSANRPGWADEVKRGDILIGGKNFGMGSSRPAARSLKNLGLSCLVAPYINGLFFRNCVNFAFGRLRKEGASLWNSMLDLMKSDDFTAFRKNVIAHVTIYPLALNQ